MAYTTLTRGGSGLVIPRPPIQVVGAPSITGTTTVSANNSVCAFVVRAPKTGNIRSFSIRFATVATGGTITMGLYQVSLATGDPANTPVAFATNSFASKAIVTGDAGDVVNSGNFTADCPVVKGDQLAVCGINPGSSPANFSFTTFADDVPNYPYMTTFNGASWTKNNTGAPVLIFYYDDGSVAVPLGCYAFGDAAAGGVTTVNFGNGTNPNHRGIAFQFPFPVRVNGVWFWVSTANDFNLRLVTNDWDGANSGLLASCIHDGTCFYGGLGTLNFFELNAAPELAANTTYRLIAQPSSASSITVYDYPLLDATQLGALPLGPQFYLTTANNPTQASSWTNFNNVTDGFRNMYMGLVVDGIGLTGGAIPLGMNGGMRG